MNNTTKTLRYEKSKTKTIPASKGLRSTISDIGSGSLQDDQDRKDSFKEDRDLYSGAGPIKNLSRKIKVLNLIDKRLTQLDKIIMIEKIYLFNT